MTKKDYIDYWEVTAEKDWVAAEHLFEKADFLHCLFFAHLTLEKLLKAHFVKDNVSDFPPKTHNLLYLLSQTSLAPTQDQLKLLSQMNQFQLDGRYPDYKLNMYKIADQPYTEALLNDVKNVIAWLKNGI